MKLILYIMSAHSCINFNIIIILKLLINNTFAIRSSFNLSHKNTSTQNCQKYRYILTEIFNLLYITYFCKL